MRLAVLGSGSKGNALLVECGSTRVLVDCGFGAKELLQRLAQIDVTPQSITALVVTHGHSDHAKGAHAFAAAFAKRTYATAATQTYGARSGGLANHVPVVATEPFQIGTLHFMPIALPHDAPGTIALRVDNGHSALGICTDLGHPDFSQVDQLGKCHTLYLEFNHDEDMLRHGPYPAWLKRRVASPQGHLSNCQAAYLLKKLHGSELKQVILAHLSEVNNTPALAMRAAIQALGNTSVDVQVADQGRASPYWSLPAAPASSPLPASPAAPPAYSLIDVAARRQGKPAVGIAARRQMQLFGGGTS